MYTREVVYEATLKYFNGDELATNVWIDKYCLKKGDEYFEKTPSDNHWRMAVEFNRIEQKYPNPMSVSEIYDLLVDFKYIIPQGSPMAGIGNNFALTSLSNCFVTGGYFDSYGGIMKSDEEQAQLMKRRGGVGKDISFIRPSGATANGTPLGPNAGTTLYMERFSNSTREVQQDGRRGALMLSIDIKHPDAEAFIDKKMIEGSVTGANVSVRITKEFMTALKEDRKYFQTFPIDLDITGHPIYELDEDQIEIDKLYPLAYGGVREFDGTYAKLVDPKKIWEKIIHNAWASAEPGILFWDQIRDESPANAYGPDWEETSTNPCGEIPLPKDDSCRLILINLYSYAYKAFTEDAALDNLLLEEHATKGMRLMDDLVDLEIEKIDAMLVDIRAKDMPEEFKIVEITLWEKIRKKAVDLSLIHI